MLAKYLLLGFINPITTLWLLSATMQLFDLSINDNKVWYSFPLMMTNVGLFILSCIFTFLLVKDIIKSKGIKL